METSEISPESLQLPKFLQKSLENPKIAQTTQHAYGNHNQKYINELPYKGELFPSYFTRYL
jgi:hypothetical protein